MAHMAFAEMALCAAPTCGLLRARQLYILTLPSPPAPRPGRLQLVATRAWQPGDVMDRLVGVIAEIPKAKEREFLVRARTPPACLPPEFCPGEAFSALLTTVAQWLLRRLCSPDAGRQHVLESPSPHPVIILTPLFRLLWRTDRLFAFNCFCGTQTRCRG